MDFTAFNAYMVCDDPLRPYCAGDIILGYEFTCKYPTYRGAYLCNIEQLEIFVDGQKVPREAIRFGVNQKFFLLSELHEMYKEYWFTGSKAIIRVLDERGLAPGKHQVKMYMKHKIPYTGYFGHYLEIESTCEKSLALCI